MVLPAVVPGYFTLGLRSTTKGLRLTSRHVSHWSTVAMPRTHSFRSVKLASSYMIVMRVTYFCMDGNSIFCLLESSGFVGCVLLNLNPIQE